MLLFVPFSVHLVLCSTLFPQDNDATIQRHLVSARYLPTPCEWEEGVVHSTSRSRTCVYVGQVDMGT